MAFFGIKVILDYARALSKDKSKLNKKIKGMP